MNISAFRAYTDPIVNNQQDSYLIEKNQLNNKLKIDDKQFNKDSMNLKSSDSLITSKERDFFVKMFPENSEQIEKHVLFNRNGRMQSFNTSLGTIIDGRI